MMDGDQDVATVPEATAAGPAAMDQSLSDSSRICSVIRL